MCPCRTGCMFTFIAVADHAHRVLLWHSNRSAALLEGKQKPLSSEIFVPVAGTPEPARDCSVRSEPAALALRDCFRFLVVGPVLNWCDASYDAAGGRRDECYVTTNDRRKDRWACAWRFEASTLGHINPTQRSQHLHEHAVTVCRYIMVIPPYFHDN